MLGMKSKISVATIFLAATIFMGTHNSTALADEQQERLSVLTGICQAMQDAGTFDTGDTLEQSQPTNSLANICLVILMLDHFIKDQEKINQAFYDMVDQHRTDRDMHR